MANKHIIRAFVICLLIASLSACGRYQRETLYQPSMPAAAEADLKGDGEYNGYLRIAPAPSMSITLSASGGVTQPPKLTMIISLDQGMTMRWTSDIAVVSDLQGGNSRNFYIGRLSFLNDCGPLPKRTCSIPDINLVDGPVDIKRYQRGDTEWERRETIRVSTSPKNLIRGTRLISDQVMLSPKEHWLKVNVPLAIGEGDPNLRECILLLPPLEINGNERKFPPIHIIQKRQTIYYPLMLF